MQRDDRFVVDELEGFEWNSEESVSYEAALEAIGELVAAYSAQIAAERSATEPDDATIQRMQNARNECAAKRRALDPTDHAEIARVRREYAAQARTLGVA